ncbi:unnamed protein product [Gongylonema pulchrum]|uniref:BLVR domain-containing protein n=1 Tax=Gongylonema pulchrum TaxID=637853 RepID=A0A183ERQ5_9BILA|nr:unnamed protein product [Gongylonema pulchrum]
MKKLMKLRHAKTSGETKEPVREKPMGMELPPDISEDVDTKPFIAETEDDENSLPSAADEKRTDEERNAPVDVKPNVPSTSKNKFASQEPAMDNKQEGKMDSDCKASSSKEADDEKQHEEEFVENTDETPTAINHDRSARRKRTRLRDPQALKREKVRLFF